MNRYLHAMHPMTLSMAAVALLVSPAAAADGTTAAPTDDAASPEFVSTWRHIADSPFGSYAAAGAWTGEILAVVDIPSARTAAYDPVADAWIELSRGLGDLHLTSPWVWTSGELIIFDSTDGSGQARAFDPVADTWRQLTNGPLREPRVAAWADGSAVVGEGDGTMAVYDLEADTWKSLPDAPGPNRLIGLFWADGEVLALTVPGNAGKAHIAALDLGTGTWGEPQKGPLDLVPSAPIWTGSELVFASGDPNGRGDVSNATYDPANEIWTRRDYECPAKSGTSVWDGTLLVDPLAGRFKESLPPYTLDPVTGECREIIDGDARTNFLDTRRVALIELAADHLILWSGAVGNDLTSAPDDRGIALHPINTD